MRVLVAMSGGVDSSVAAALMLREGHEVVGATMKLWGGPSDSGCCSVADVEDARRVCQQLGIAHHVFNFTAEFERDVVAPYVDAHAQARTPNPCIACNAHLKFGRFLQRAPLLGFDAIATGHHARVTKYGDDLAAAPWSRRRQGPVVRALHARPGRARSGAAAYRGADQGRGAPASPPTSTCAPRASPTARTSASSPRTGGRASFVGERIPLREGRLVGTDGDELGTVDALELVTVGQRRGLGLHAVSLPERRYVVDVDLPNRTATVGTLEDLLVGTTANRRDVVVVPDLSLPGAAVQVQLSAHGRPLRGQWLGGPDPALGRWSWRSRRAVLPPAKRWSSTPLARR